MSGTSSHVRRRWVWVPVLAALLAAVLAAAGSGGASAQDDGYCDDYPEVVESSFTSMPTHRSSDWTVDGSFWERPPADSDEGFDTYESGDVIEVTHRFDQNVDVDGTIGTTLWIGGKWRGASYASGSGTTSLKFHYTVQDKDLDLNGAKIGQSWSHHSGIFGSGTVTCSEGGGEVDTFVYDSVEDPNHKVGPVPYVTNIEVVAADSERVFVQPDPETGVKTIETHGMVQLRVTYNTPVVVEGSPTFRLHIGNDDAENVEDGFRDARFHTRGYYNRNVLTFHYFVEGGLSDTDGISVMNGHLGGTIKAVSGGQEAESYSFLDYRRLADIQVDAPVPPKATGFEIISEPTHRTELSADDNTYDVGDEIKIEVTFSEPIKYERGLLVGPATLPINIGGKQRIAVNDDREYGGTGDVADGTGNTEVFTYVVTEDDVDADGISIDRVTEDDLYKGGVFTIGKWAWLSVGFNTHIVGVDSGLLAGAIHDGMPAHAGHRVGNIEPRLTGAEIVSTPKDGDTYTTFENIEVALIFDTEVEADEETGFEVYLDIGQGSPERGDEDEDFAVATYSRGNGTDTLVFSYTLQGGEFDPDGVSVYGFLGAVTSVNGGVYRDWEYIFDELPGDNDLFSSQPDHNVAAHHPPSITDIEIVSRPEHRTPEAGRSADAYNAGDDIIFKVTFDEGIAFTEALTADALLSDDPNRPSLDINVGGTTRRAWLTITYAPETDGGSGSGQQIEGVENPFGGSAVADDTVSPELSGPTEVYFAYRVQAEDYDADGVSVDPFTAASTGFNNAIESASTGVPVSANHRGLSNQQGHRVGGLQPRLVSIGVNAPVSGDTFHLGEAIQIVLTYNTPVTVDPEASIMPYFGMAIGTNWRDAEEEYVEGSDGTYRLVDYASGSGTTALVFEHTVEARDEDDDGIELFTGPFIAYDSYIRATSGGLNAERFEIDFSDGDTLNGFNGSPGYNVSGTARPLGGV